MLRILLFSVIVNCSFLLYAQQEKYTIVNIEVDEQDTLIIVPLEEVHIYGFKTFKSKREYRRNSRLIRNVKKVYPWAKLAGQKLNEYNEVLMEAETEKERRKILRKAEMEIKEEYEADLRKLTFSQGKILIKLIDRETANTSYELVDDLRGSFTAFFYQTFARIFGYNLKTEYDPTGADRNIEFVVMMIENGQI